MVLQVVKAQTVATMCRPLLPQKKKNGYKVRVVFQFTLDGERVCTTCKRNPSICNRYLSLLCGLSPMPTFIKVTSFGVAARTVAGFELAYLSAMSSYPDSLLMRPVHRQSMCFIDMY